MPTLSELIESKSNRLDGIPTDFTNAVNRAQKKLLREMVSLMGGFDLSDGRIEVTSKNLALAQELGEKMRAAMVGGDYMQVLEAFLSEWNPQAKLNNQIFSKSFSFTDKQIYRDMLEATQRNALAILGEGAVSNVMSEPFSKILTDSVGAGASFTDAINEITEFIIGNERLEGAMLSYAKQHARNIFTSSDATYIQTVGDELGFEWYRYDGGLLKDSRNFCKSKAGKIFHTTEIENWIVEAPWQGMIPGTNRSTIWTLRGGYNCIHHFLPIAESEVPASIKSRIK